MNMDNRGGQYAKKPYYNIYKPLKKDSAGAALQFSYDDKKRGVFLEATKQKGPKLPVGHKDQFDWSNKIVFKLGTADIGQMLLLFSGRESSIKCIHKPENGNHTSVFEIQKQTGDYSNYKVSLSKNWIDEDGNKQNGFVSIYVDHHEMAVLAHLIRESLTRMLGFQSEN